MSRVPLSNKSSLKELLTTAEVPETSGSEQAQEPVSPPGEASTSRRRSGQELGKRKQHGTCVPLTPWKGRRMGPHTGGTVGRRGFKLDSAEVSRERRGLGEILHTF